MAIVYGDSVKALCARVALRIADQLEQGKVPWVCPYQRKGGPPFNVVRRVRDSFKGVYTGINRFLLELEMWANGWRSPAFLTMNQLKDMNPGKDPDGPRLLHVSGAIPMSPDDWRCHGQEPCHVIVFKEGSRWVRDGKKVPLGTPGAEEQRSYFGRTYPVFNVAQIANLPADIKEAAAVATGPWTPECVPAEIVAAIEEMKLAGGVVSHDMPHYNARLDQIGMPPFKAFVSEDAYLATLLHEAGHAAGNPTRVGREARGDTRSEQLAAYAREELCAEFTSAMAMAAFGLPPSQELQHVGYLQSYCAVLKADPAILVWAASQAEKRTGYLVEKARERATLSAAAAAAP
jgi:antirestriction protein ArdC